MEQALCRTTKCQGYLSAKVVKVSDLQDLIHINAHNAFGIGVRTERERIIQILDSLDISFIAYEDRNYDVGDALDLIEIIREESE